MDRSSRIAQIYGYAVCLISLVTLLIAVPRFVEAAFARGNPLQARDAYGPYNASLTSFEAFRATYPAERAALPPPRPEGPAPASADTLSTAELRARFEALRADQIARVTFQATRELVQSGLLVTLALVLFLTHWRWLRGRGAADG